MIFQFKGEKKMLKLYFVLCLLTYTSNAFAHNYKTLHFHYEYIYMFILLVLTIFITIFKAK